MKNLLLIFSILLAGVVAFGQTTDDKDYKEAMRLLGKRKISEAIVSFNKAIKNDPTNLNAYMNRGVALIVAAL